MKRETNLCMSCMEINPNANSDNNQCPSCGWIDNAVHLSSYLFPRTVLAGRYIVGKLISYNGEAALYIGYDTFNETKAVIKEYMPDALCNRAKEILPLSVNQGELPLYKTYMSEFIELNRSLQSFGSMKGIQRVTDVFSENNTAYAILEFIQGNSVKNELINPAGGFLSPKQAAELFLPLFSALAKVNTAGIIHRGVSPKTVFMNPDAELYITDFAITAARINGSKINSEVFAGYAAPEQYNSGRHGGWTDVYGLSALLYNILTGIVPQSADARLENDYLSAPLSVPDNVAKAIMRGVELSVENRIKNIGEFWRIFSDAVGVRSVSESVTLTSLPALRTIGGSGGTGDFSHVEIPQINEINVDFDSAYEDNSNSGEYGENQRVSKKKLERERKAKIKRIAVISSISAIVVTFTVLIIVAVAGGFKKPEPDPNDPAATTTSGTTAASTDSTTTEPIVDELTEEVELLDFVGRKYNENWINNYSYLKFKIEYEYSNEHEEGTVFAQSVPAKEMVAVGSEISLKCSLGKEFIQLPNFNGAKVKDFEKTLKSLNIRPENIKIEDKEADDFDFESEDDMVTDCSIKVGGNVRLTNFPGDPARMADIVVIYKAIPKEGATAPTEATTEPPTEPLTEPPTNPDPPPTDPPAPPDPPDNPDNPDPNNPDE